ncbi:MAG: tRNA (uridine(34)/cytosine(34)/5-carboxymethylaminomethyluridine(34)-2'-O)-methyltransferase TrmL [Bdellovibrionales bacterium CG10_big_fil_rev_8_21_14_0_10_45_34]|nr:MAG: tRNA (uridine(34)/cytosine(34)/5-carboxymethylaminomethyluridine(34)-2'-O)-methyltransferase TrmL [Bdellovibrionales bacterium CG10_big_fil_rev_8_21_14_0_10_45_34]
MAESTELQNGFNGDVEANLKSLASPLFRIVLVEPEIPNNTGNLGRTCVGALSELHLVGKLGFEITDKQLKRSGLDYWPHLSWFQHDSFESWYETVDQKERIFFFTTRANQTLYDIRFQQGDWLVFGRETRGLDPSILKRFPQQLAKIPQPGQVRSLNLSNAASIVLYEGIRQLIR